MSVALRRPAQRSRQHSPTATASWEVRYGRRLVIADAVIVISAAFAAAAIFGDRPHGYLWSTCLGIVWLAALAVFGSRANRVVGNGSAEFRLVLQASFSTFGLLAIVAYLFDLELARGYFTIALPAGASALVVTRWAWRSWLRTRRARGEFSARAVLVGSAASVTHIARELARHPKAGFQVMGVCVAPGADGRHVDDDLGGEIRVIGSYDRVLDAVEASGADTVIVTSSEDLSPERIRRLSWQLEPGRQHLIVAPSLTDIGGPRIHTRPVAGLPLIHVETPRYEGRKQYTKRAFDIAASGLLILFLSPVFAAIAIAVRLSTPGDLFFAQKRVGLNGDLFTMLKFRSMIPDAEQVLADLEHGSDGDRDAGNSVLFKMKDDPRVTPIGRVLRRYSLDELPQLFNVLLGDMSLVGPRPSLEREVEAYERHVHRRFLVKPGITGLWQVSGRSNLSWEESVRLDLYYVENWTLTGDLVILWKTARAVVASQGAY